MEEGIIGFICYAVMLLAAVSAVMKLPRPERRFAQVLMATLLIGMAPLTWEDHKPVWLILGIVVGLSQASVSLRQRTPEPAPVPASEPARGFRRRGPAPGPPPPSRAVG